MNGCHGLGESVLTFDAGVLSQVIDNHLAGMDVIIDEWHPSLRTTPAENRNPGQAEPCGAYNLLRAVRPELCFFLLHRHKFCVNGYQHSRPRKLDWVKEVMFDAAVIAIAEESTSAAGRNSGKCKHTERCYCHD